MYITDYCKPEYIYLDIESSSKYECLKNLFKYLTNEYPETHILDIQNNLIRREKLSSTGIGNSLAVPHCRCEKIKEPSLKIFRSKESIEFESFDNKPVKLVFLMLLPKYSKNEHLLILSKIAKIGKNKIWVNQLLKSLTSEEFYKDLVEFDHNL